MRINALGNTATDFASDDYIAIDGSTNGSRKMKNDSLLKVTAQNALAGNVAPAFDPTRTSDNQYSVNDKVIYQGELYLCRKPHYGAWVSSDFKKIPISDLYPDGTDVEIQHPDDSSFVKVLHGSDLIRGRIDENGVWIDHLSRVCTLNFIPVKANDQIIMAVKNSHVCSYVSFYDENKTFVSSTNWSPAHDVGGGGNNITVPADGFVKFTFYRTDDSSTITKRSQIDYFNESICIARLGCARYFDPAFYEKLCAIGNKLENIIFTDSMLERGYWLYSGGVFTKTGVSTRVRNAVNIHVDAGDILAVTDTNIQLNVMTESETDGTMLFESGYCWGAQVQYSGQLILQAKKTDGTTVYTSDVANKIILYRLSENQKDVYISDKNCIKKGYFDANNKIQNHSKRIVNYKPIFANRGDVLMVNASDLMMNVRELNAVTNQQIGSTSEYFTTIYKAPGQDSRCGYYVVQNDNVVLLCQLARFDNADIDLTQYYDCIKLLRLSNHSYDYERLNKITPASSRKGRVIPSSGFIGMQDGSFVGDELWVSNDYNNEYTIKVIDPQDGSIVKTISHDFGHNGISDYCEETDVLLVVGSDGHIYIKENASTITTSISKSGCIDIDATSLDGAEYSCGCFGENKQTIYIAVGYDLGAGMLRNKIYKIWLGMTNGAYDGTFTLIGTYSGYVYGGVDADFGTFQQNYAQSCKYDGYLYLAYGTSGHNFLLVDFDDYTMTWKPVGRIAYEYFTTDHTKKYLEPEFVAIKGEKIVCGSRHYNEGISSIVEFQRGL